MLSIIVVQLDFTRVAVALSAFTVKTVINRGLAKTNINWKHIKFLNSVDKK